MALIGIELYVLNEIENIAHQVLVGILFVLAYLLLFFFGEPGGSRKKTGKQLYYRVSIKRSAPILRIRRSSVWRRSGKP